MSSSIVIALPKIEDAKKIRTILNRHGLTVASVCSSVSNALASISELDSGVLICGYKLTDAYYKDALDDLPQYFEMLLLASQRIIDEAPNSVSTVQMPMKASVLIDTVNDMLYHLERRIKKEKKKPKPRSEKEQNYISNAKRLLMEKKVTVIPGNAFGASGEGFVRISYSYSMAHLTEALQRIGSFLEELGV